jgi:hypothetical protein
MNGTLIPQQLKESTDKWGCMKLKSFCTAKETFTILKKQPTEWKKIFSSYMTDKGLITIIQRELNKLTSQIINYPLNNGQIN